MKSRIAVVLVEPQTSRNIGSVARAMKNFGYYDLRLVRPVHFSQTDAAVTACQAGDLISSARCYDTLEESLADCTDVLAFSARTGRNRKQISLPEIGGELGINGISALLFGPEDTGLRKEHLALARLVVEIPAATDYPSFNVSQAVLLALAEIFRAPPSRDAACDLPEQNEFQQLDRLVKEAASKSGFYREGTPEPIPRMVQSLFRRARPDLREMRILLGLFSRINRHIDFIAGSRAAEK
ncbi:MAG: hypothetical protein J5J00_15025 [Deltaproteobacteria bacterium]|nr:hypothetical protein [Deltaproteobacteria bacterium]